MSQTASIYTQSATPIASDGTEKRGEMNGPTIYVCACVHVCVRDVCAILILQRSNQRWCLSSCVFSRTLRYALIRESPCDAYSKRKYYLGAANEKANLEYKTRYGLDVFGALRKLTNASSPGGIGGGELGGGLTDAAWIRVKGNWTGVKEPGNGSPENIEFSFDTTQLALADANNNTDLAADRSIFKEACVHVIVDENPDDPLDKTSGKVLFTSVVPVKLEVARKCPMGYQSEGPDGNSPCQKCPKDTYQSKTGETACPSCRSAPGRKQTVSTFGFTGNPHPDACLDCPSGALCTASLATNSSEAQKGGGSSSVQVTIKAKSGFYREERCIKLPLANGSSPLTFRSCPTPSRRCLGGPNIQYLVDEDMACNASNTSAGGSATVCCDDPEKCEVVDAAILSTLDFGAGRNSERCNYGYEGALCSACKPGFAMQSDSSCGDCAPYPVLAGLAAVAVVLACGGTVWMIRSALLESGRKKNIGVELLKISYNHIQLLSVMIFFDLKWPSAIRNRKCCCTYRTTTQHADCVTLYISIAHGAVSRMHNKCLVPLTRLLTRSTPLLRSLARPAAQFSSGFNPSVRAAPMFCLPTACSTARTVVWRRI